MDAPRDDLKGDGADSAGVNKAEPEVLAGTTTTPAARRERTRVAATPRAHGTAQPPAGATGGEVAGADQVAHDVNNAVVEMSRATMGAVQAATEATVEMAQHALGIAEAEPAAPARHAAGPAGEEVSALMRAAQTSPGRSASAGADVFSIFAESAEASLRVALDIQTAALSAGLSMLEAAIATNRELARQWAVLAHDARQAAMVAWKTRV